MAGRGSSGEFHQRWNRDWTLLLVAVGLALAAVVLGYVGFQEHLEGQRTPRDYLYMSLQLLTWELDASELSNLPWKLEVARFLAPTATYVALFIAVYLAFRDAFEGLRLRMKRNHVLVCGLGERGSQIVGQLIDEGRTVVAVEQDPANPAIVLARSRNVPVVVGDASDADVLRRARIQHATHLVSVTNSDSVNARVAEVIADLPRGRARSTLSCVIHIENPQLCALLRASELEAPRRENLDLDFFNMDDQAAKALLRKSHWREPTSRSNESADIVLVGQSSLGTSLVVEVARTIWNSGQPPSEELSITIIDYDADGLVRHLRSRHPRIEEVVQLRGVNACPSPLDDVALRASAQTDPALVCVCLADTTAGLEAAIQIRDVLSARPGVIAVQAAKESGLIELLNQTDDGGRNARRIVAFDHAESLNSDLVLGGTYEVLARSIHETYLAEQRRQGATSATNPAIVPWEELPESLKLSNRAQARHIGKKMREIGYGIAPWIDWEASSFAFSERDLEFLAQMEHERWVDERIADGWKLGTKDHATKRSPYLISWERLGEDVREWDRQAVRAIPRVLARSGFQIMQARVLQIHQGGSETV